MSNAAFWKGVLPAITTPFNADGSVDHAFLAKHALQLVEAGCTAIVPLGSLGEAATLSFEEKIAIIRTLVKAVDGRVPVVPGIASLSTDEAVKLAQAAKAAGAGGLMVLPVYVYTSDWHEAGAYARAVLGATDLPCILYNNPVAYRTDILPAQIAQLAGEFPNLQAVKESSGEIRRFAAIKELLGDRLVLLVGMDDAIVEGLAMGAQGWIAGLVNAYPVESVKLFELARDGGYAAAAELYHWFLPLLRLDTVPKFVQLIKLVQAKVGMGSETVRAPRLVIEGAEREAVLKVIDHAIATKPSL
ncbi:dihydrodipicolinate synthase family protein [Pseudoxanthomonas winnipegensis]|uniref:dihydrodipicolinate synthase family protein n=1 Tax=Pseudoxanthomonas winnipegensis TaxID=2480810 RepID=UPI002578CFF0|nr:dihydrodipicolinate synthase family protein [Pseudoxanthomonas winnipegensis]WJI17515.1 dihydrodipicolinate synthase family protein [Pseudoxanthomonas winnipegensis]